MNRISNIPIKLFKSYWNNLPKTMTGGCIIGSICGTYIMSNPVNKQTGYYKSKIEHTHDTASGITGGAFIGGALGFVYPLVITAYSIAETRRLIYNAHTGKK